MFQVEHICLLEPMDSDGEEGKLTPGQSWLGSTPSVMLMLQIPNIGVREGVPHQPLPHQTETDRDGSPALSHRETN